MEALTGLIVGIISFFGGIENDAGQFASAANSSGDSKSVELGISELSPRGESGGYAMPASGDSLPDAFCNVSFGSATITEGNDTDVILSSNMEEVHTGDGGIWPEIVRGGTTIYPRQEILPTNELRVSAQSSGLAPGSYQYDATIDYWHGHSHTITCNSGTLTVESASASVSEPDLDPRTFTSAELSETRTAGQPTNFSYVIDNIGDADAGSFDNEYDIDYDGDGVAEVTIDDVGTVSSLAAGGNVTVTGQDWTPPSAGTYHIIRRADSNNTVAESDEGNNYGPTWQQFTVGEATPNLVSQNLNIPALTEGEASTISAEVHNNGGEGTGSGFDDIFEYSYSSDTGPWTQIGTLVPKSALASGATSNDSRSFTPPNSGTIWIQHCIDHGDQIAESDESVADNCETSGAIDVASAPDVTADLEIGVNGAFSDPAGNSISVDTTDDLDFRWTSENADSCSVINGGTHGFSASNPEVGTNLNGTDTSITTPDPGTTERFEIACSGSGNPDSDFIDVSVNTDKPTLTTNCPSLVEIGTQCDFTYDDGGNTNCVLEGPGADEPVSGSGTVEDITIEGESTYQLVCDEDSSDPVTIRVQPGGGET